MEGVGEGVGTGGGGAARGAKGCRQVNAILAAMNKYAEGCA